MLEAQAIPVGQAVQNAVGLSCLTGPGAHPFHLKATTTPANSFIPDYTAEIEEYWISPTKWRRIIRSKSFDQTIVVNGNRRFEKSSNDYYPKWLNDIVVTLFDIAPQELIDRTAKLPDTVEAGKPTKIKYQPSSTDGKVTNMWWSSVEFNRDGLLTWISGELFGAGFDHYREFHGKQVAQNVETFPPIPHGDVSTRVEVSDYASEDDSMFAVETPTPPQDQLRIVRVNEIEYRKSAMNQPEMRWAPVKRRPTAGVLSLSIVTDKFGKVREADFITSNNMDIRENAESLVRQWQFKPTIIDGVPAEVETTMTFAYETTVEGDQGKYEAASSYFKRGRDLTYPRTDGSTSFHMVGSFAWTDSNSTRAGEYEEFWIAPDRWRREFTIGGQKVVETRLYDDHYWSSQLDNSGLMSHVVSLFTAEFPGYAYYSPDWDWHMDEIKLQERLCLRVSMGPLDNLPAGQYPRAYYFDTNGLVLARSQGKEMISYSDFETWDGKQVPRQITLKFGDSVVLGARITAIEPTQVKEDSFFIISKVKPRDWNPPPW